LKPVSFFLFFFLFFVTFLFELDKPECREFCWPCLELALSKTITQWLVTQSKHLTLPFEVWQSRKSLPGWVSWKYELKQSLSFFYFASLPFIIYITKLRGYYIKMGAMNYDCNLTCWLKSHTLAFGDGIVSCFMGWVWVSWR